MTEPPLVLDTDLLSSFAWVNRLDILEKLFAKQMIILDEVMDELSKIWYLAKQVQSCIENGSIKLVPILASDPEALELAHIIDEGKLGRGEAACMAYLKYNEGTLGSNNLADIKKRCIKKNISLITTSTVINHAYQTNLLTEEEANDLWIQISKKQKLPSSTFSEFRTSPNSK